MNTNASIDFPSGAKLILVENFFPAGLANDINALFRLPRDQWDANTAFSHVSGRLTYNNPHPTRNAIDNFAVQMQDIVGSAINSNVKYVDHSLWLDIPGYTIAPHTDAPGYPEIAVQIYMGDPELVWEMLGFCVYTEQRRGHALFEAHYRINAGYICLHPHKLIHGLNHHIGTQFVRNSVYMRYCEK